MLLIKKYSIAPAASADSSLNHQKISREITNYTNSVHSLDMELHDFWRRNKALYQLARVVHAVPATSADIERVWSTYGLILSSRRQDRSQGGSGGHDSLPIKSTVACAAGHFAPARSATKRKVVQTLAQCPPPVFI